MNGRVDRFQVSEGVRHEDRDSGAGAVLDGDSAGPGGRWHDDEVMQVVAQSAAIRLLRTGWPRRKCPYWRQSRSNSPDAYALPSTNSCRLQTHKRNETLTLARLSLALRRQVFLLLGFGLSHVS